MLVLIYPNPRPCRHPTPWLSYTFSPGPEAPARRPCPAWTNPSQCLREYSGTSATPPARTHARSGSSAASSSAHGTNITRGPAPVLSTLQHTVSPSSAYVSSSDLEQLECRVVPVVGRKPLDPRTGTEKVPGRDAVFRRPHLRPRSPPDPVDGHVRERGQHQRQEERRDPRLSTRVARRVRLAPRSSSRSSLWTTRTSADCGYATSTLDITGGSPPSVVSSGGILSSAHAPRSRSRRLHEPMGCSPHCAYVSAHHALVLATHRAANRGRIFLWTRVGDRQRGGDLGGAFV